MSVIELMMELIKMNPLDQIFVREGHIMVVPAEIIEEHDDGVFIAMDMEKALVLCLHEDSEE